MNEAINGLVGEMQKMKTMKAGEMLVKASQEKPTFIAEQTVSGIKRNSSIGSNLRRVTGDRS